MSKKIKRTHFLKLKDDFEAVGINPNHWVREIEPTPERITSRVSRIPFGWIKKKIYDPEVLPDRMIAQKMRLFDLMDGDQEKPVGYVIAIIPEETIQKKFLSAVKNYRPIEIENIALFPNEAGKGRGRSFLNLIQARFFREGHGLVYLNTSATNHPTIPDFYRRAGMTDLGQDEVPNFNIRKQVKQPEVA